MEVGDLVPAGGVKVSGKPKSRSHEPRQSVTRPDGDFSTPIAHP